MTAGAGAPVRAFAAADIGPDARDALARAMDGLLRAGMSAAWTSPQNLHVTLRFFGQVTATQIGGIDAALKDSATAHAPFEAGLGALGCFPESGSPKIIWAGIDEGNGAFCALAAEMARRCQGFGQEQKRDSFVPHVTLARLKHQLRDAPEIMRAAGIRPKARFTVSSVVLYKSTLTQTGPVYEPIARYPLTGRTTA